MKTFLMKRFVLTLLLGVVAMAEGLSAGTNPVSVFIWLKDGQKTVLQLSEKPKMTFSEDDMKVTTRDAVVYFPYDQLKSITYGDATTGVEGWSQKERTFVFDGESLTFQAGSTPLKVLIMRLDGVMIRNLNVQANKRVNIASSKLPKGSYAVVVNGVTYKIVKP